MSNDRPETGPMQFGDDWPGLFIRGDNAFGYARILEDFLRDPTSPIAKSQVRDLINLLDGSAASSKGPRALLKEYKQCLIVPAEAPAPENPIRPEHRWFLVEEEWVFPIEWRAQDYIPFEGELFEDLEEAQEVGACTVVAGSFDPAVVGVHTMAHMAVDLDRLIEEGILNENLVHLAFAPQK